MNGAQSLTFGGWIKSLRESKGLSQIDLADKMGFASPMISRVESGERRVTAEFAVAFAVAMGMPIDEVLLEAGLIPESAMGRVSGVLNNVKTLVEINRLLDEIDDLEERERTVHTVQAVIRAAIERKTARRKAKASPKHGLVEGRA